MKKRNPIAVILLSFITFGIYSVYWAVKTKGELVSRGADIPTSWLLIVPLVNIWWLWKYCEGVEKVTNGNMTGVVAFLLWFVLGPIGAGIIQDQYNKHTEVAAPAAGTVAPTPPAASAPTTDTPAAPAASTPPAAPATPPTPPAGDDNPPASN